MKMKHLFFILIPILGITIILFSMSLATLTENTTIEIFSEEADFEQDEEGSWKLTEEASWKSEGRFHVDVTLESKEISDYIGYIPVIVLDLSSSMINSSDILQFESMIEEKIGDLFQAGYSHVFLIGFDKTSQVNMYYIENNEVASENIYGEINFTRDVNYSSIIDAVNYLLSEYGTNMSINAIIISDSMSDEDLEDLEDGAENIRGQLPFLSVSGISYKTNGYVLKELDAMSDVNYTANNVNELSSLLDKLLYGIRYEDFYIEEYINSDDFTIDQTSIKASVGEVTVDGDMISWEMINSYLSGSTATLEYDLIINEESQDDYKMFYSHNSHTVYSLFDELYEDIYSEDTLVLSNDYTLSFLPNTPSGCTVTNMPSSSHHHVGEIFRVTSTEPTCTGYKFNGWKTVKVAADSYKDWYKNDMVEMPKRDLELKATWSKLNVTKSLSGSVYGAVSFYNRIAALGTLDNNLNVGDEITPLNSRVYEMYSTRNDSYPIYYYHGDVDNNNVLIGDECYKIIRTTSTGGIKLIYNGDADNGTCDNDFTETSIGESPYMFAIEDIMGDGEGDLQNLVDESVLNYLVFKNSYSYNDLSNDFIFKTNILSNDDMSNIDVDAGGLLSNDTGGGLNDVTENYWYADDVSYNSSTGNYTLIDPVKNQTTTYGDLEKKYTCRSTTNKYCSEVIMYVKEFNMTNERVGTVKFTNGNRLDDSENNIVYGSGVSYNNGEYVLTNTYTVNFADVVDEMENIRDYRYTCYNDSGTCSQVHYRLGMISDEGILSLEDQELMQILQDNNIERIETANDFNFIETEMAKSYDYDYVAGLLMQVIYMLEVGLFENKVSVGVDYTFVLHDGQTVADCLDLIADTQTNGVYDSYLKDAIENWFSQNTNFTTGNAYNRILEDTVFCEDHTILTQSNGNLFSYGPAARLTAPSFTCTNSYDRYTVSNSIGNGQLTYPVGNITMDEITLTAWPDYADSNFWTMSPAALHQHVLKTYNSRGHTIAPYVKLDVKPVLSLKPGVRATEGTGYANDPYVILIN